jgi:hypothetical protein
MGMLCWLCIIMVADGLRRALREIILERMRSGCPVAFRRNAKANIQAILFKLAAGCAKIHLEALGGRI